MNRRLLLRSGALCATIPLPELLDAARARVAATSLRRTAREVGLSPTGLSLLLGGRRPQPATLARLAAWHMRGLWRDPVAGVDAGTAAMAMDLLVRHIAPEDRPAAAERILLAVRGATEAAGAPRPTWVDAEPVWRLRET